MILSNLSIHAALDEGRLILNPQPSPREPTEGKECPYQTSSVDLTLDEEIKCYKADLPLSVNLAATGGFSEFLKSYSFSHFLSDQQPFVLTPGRFVLGQTVEWVELPLMENGRSLAARVEGKSSFARCGLLVHFTAPTIHAGFKGNITLELYNLGPLNLVIYRGAPICQLIVEEVEGKPFPNKSQFHGQTKPGGGTD